MSCCACKRSSSVEASCTVAQVMLGMFPAHRSYLEADVYSYMFGGYSKELAAAAAIAVR